jgi:hypothetical protein
MDDRPRATLAQILKDPKCAAALDAIMTRMSDGWASGPQIAWQSLGNSRGERFYAYRVIEVLTDEGLWETMTARHNDAPLALFNVDIAAVREAVEGWAQ